MIKNVLVLGAGLISPPLVRHLLSRTDHRLLVAALDVRRAQAVMEGFSRGRVVQLDVTETAAVEPLVREADIVVSLLPAKLNPKIGWLALRHRVPLVNTSYVEPALREMDAQARDTGVLILSEIGLDPGFDHMSALRGLRALEARGGRVRRFASAAGGLPAPEANTNPWGYKFSWFPRAVMLAARNPARYLRHGVEVAVPAEQVFARSWPCDVPGPGVLELFANRDALAYRDAYSLQNAEGLFRGTIRYPGWCATLAAVTRLGLLDLDERDWPEGTTYADLATRHVPAGPGPVVERVAGHLGLAVDDPVISRLEWAGLVSDRPLPERRAAPLDLFVARLERLMLYAPGERDMVVVQHRAEASFPDGHTEVVVGDFVAFGEPWGDSAMARTVALPAAVATRLILSGHIETVGVHIPTIPELYRPILGELDELGFGIRERIIERYASPFD